MSEPLSWRAAYAERLRELHLAAGGPPGEAMAARAKARRPRVRFSVSSWSEWRRGIRVPSDEATAHWLIEEYLRPLAHKMTPGFVTQPPEWWEETRRKARAELDTGGRPPIPHPVVPPYEPPPVVQVGQIPAEADCFQDRDIATRLRQAASKDGTVVLCQVLAGMGGVGKTQLAAAYARHAREQGVRVLVWATASSRPAIIEAYADAAVKLGLADGEDPERAACEFLVWADTTVTAWLVVLDDVHNLEDLRELWPPACPAGTAVVTTRRRDAALAGPRRHMVEVGLYTTDEARSYLHAKLGALAGEQAQLDALIEDLGWLPLALAQAAAFMIDQQIGCARYRDLFAERLLAHTVPELGGLPDGHREIIAATWDLSIEQADRVRPAGFARPMMNLTSVLDPNGIPATVLTSAPAREYLATYLPPPSAGAAKSVTEIDGDTIDEALRVLHRFSLIDHDRNATHREVRVHQLIQRATRENLATEPNLGPDLYTELAHTAADALEAAWPAIERDQIGAVLRANTAVLHTATGTALWEWNGEAHPVLLHSANSLGETGQVNEAIAECTRLRTIATDLVGPHDPHTLTIRGSLAHWRGRAGDVAGAVTAVEELLADQLRVLGPDHPATLETRGYLVAWRVEAGDVVGAAAAVEELLADQLRVLGPDHPHTLGTRHNLAYSRGEAGDAAGAATAYEGLLADFLRVLGPDHPHTLETRGYFAHWRGEAGDAAGAATAYEGLLADFLRVLGPDHPQTLATRVKLARWRELAGDTAGAASTFEKLLADFLRVLGPDHVETLTTRAILANRRGKAGDAAGAAANLAELLADQLRVLGPDHPHTLDTRAGLANWRGKAGDAAGAAADLEELLADQLRVLGPDHPSILNTRIILANWRGKAGDAAGAATTHDELLANLLRLLGPDHPHTLATRSNLAHWRGEAGDAAGAATAYGEVLADCLRVLGPDHPDTLTTRGNLARWQECAGLA
ncbi:hypothetical protein GCM10022226_74080 [Sphaerisporangium flaviroseum]|uniref:Tetratricopeptide repeat protein n=1 Tax=Sphaerisporangium flaviroseum TaxID=509199 RepID=A0ABP7JCV9_9ACTN